MKDNDLEQLASEYLGVLQYEDNPKYNSVVIHECMVCHKYRTIENNYISIHPALKEIYKTDKQYQISSGFCISCFDAYKQEQGIKDKGKRE